MIADSAAMRISQASASANPAPAAGPGSAAIVGFLTATSAPVKVRCFVRKSATRSSIGISALVALLPMPLTSPPAQKAEPAPDIRSAPTLGSSPHCLIIRRSAGVSRSDSALRASGRLSVMSATRSLISHNSSLVPVSTSIRSSAISTAPVLMLSKSRTRSSDKQLFPNGLHEFAIRRWKRCGPGRFVAGLGQQVSEFAHLPRRQFPDIDPAGAAVFHFGHVSDRLRHQSDHSRLVHGRASASDMPIDEELIMVQRRASHEVVAGLHLIENDLGKKARGAGDLAMDARDLAGNLALLFSREPTLQGRAEIGRHRLTSGVASTANTHS